jgi:hypothetical protein
VSAAFLMAPTQYRIRSQQRRCGVTSCGSRGWMEGQRKRRRRRSAQQTCGQSRRPANICVVWLQSSSIACFPRITSEASSSAAIFAKILAIASGCSDAYSAPSTSTYHQGFTSGEKLSVRMRICRQMREARPQQAHYMPVALVCVCVIRSRERESERGLCARERMSEGESYVDSTVSTHGERSLDGLRTLLGSARHNNHLVELLGFPHPNRLCEQHRNRGTHRHTYTRSCET